MQYAKDYILVKNLEWNSCTLGTKLEEPLICSPLSKTASRFLAPFLPAAFFISSKIDHKIGNSVNS